MNLINSADAVDVCALIRGYYSSLSTSEKKVADYIMENSEGAVRMTLADVAKGSGVSDATALRFCRAIGYGGWLEFKIDLTKISPNKTAYILDDVEDDDSPGLIARKVFNNSMNALRDTLAVFDDTDFANAVKLLVEAEKIFIVGVGTSGPMANEMRNRFMRLGGNCSVQTDSYLQIMEGSLLGPRDVVVIISQTGDSEDPRRTASLVKTRGCKTIVITGNTGSKLTDFADVVLLSVSHETRIETIASRIAQYALIHSLYVGVAMQDIESTMQKEKTIWDAAMNQKGSYQSAK